MGSELVRLAAMAFAIGGLMLIMVPFALIAAYIEAKQIRRRSQIALDKYLALWDCIQSLRKLSYRDAATALDEKRYSQLLDRYWEQMVESHRDIVERRTTGRQP